jgi:hypothetical protein
MLARTIGAGTASDAAAAKIYVVTDLEGVSGVFRFPQTRDTDTPLARQARDPAADPRDGAQAGPPAVHQRPKAVRQRPPSCLQG